MAKLTLRLLGEPRIGTTDDPDMRLSTKKSLALLVYLASPAGVSRSRDQLAGLLWGRSAEEQARSSLRQCLTRLRKSLGPAKVAIVANAHEIQLDPVAVETDTAMFDALSLGEDVTSLTAAAKLIRGEFASGLHVNEGPFESWLEGERRRLTERAVPVLGRLLAYHEDHEDHESAADIACRLLRIDPLQERAHQSFMRALAHQNRFELALQQYKICRDLLRKELGIDPSTEIRTLRDDIARRRAAEPHVTSAPAVETPGLLRAVSAALPNERRSEDTLPPQLQGLDLTVPERPSIVILPFRNLTNDSDNDHLAEGVRIDIQAALVKITGLFLIAAGSANAMRGRDADVAGHALGVRYVLQGSVRRAGQNLRISTELIDVERGLAIWTETYDRRFDDGFEVQDEIIEAIITALDVKLLRGEQAAVWHRTLKKRDALECFYRGVDEFFKLRPETVRRARRQFEQVDRMQPDVGTGATWVALCHWFDAFKGWGVDPEASLIAAGEWSAKAVKMEDADGQAHMVLSHVHLMNRCFDDALIVGREAIQLRPNCTNANGFFANVLHYCGEQTEAIEHVTWAIRYSPVYPPFFADVLSLAFLFDDSFDAAAAVANESLRLNPVGVTARLVTVAAYAAQDRIYDAQGARDQIIAADNGFSVKGFGARLPYRNPEDLDRLMSRLRAAGLPP